MSRLFLAVLLVCFSLAPAAAHDLAAPARIEQLAVDKLSDRIYVVHGPQVLPSVQTRGFMNNPGFVVAPGGVIVVDPGSSVEIGQVLLQKIRSVTPNPVIAVFNTHVHGDHWLGNQAIRRAYPEVPIYAHARMIERVQAGEGEEWIRLLLGMTDDAIAGTRVVGPNVGLTGGETLTLDGLTLRIHHIGKAHTDHDIMIEVVDEKSLFLGDVVTSERVPSSDVPGDASYQGQIDAMRAVLRIPARLFIPGHGRSGGKEIPQASLAFLDRLYDTVRTLYEQGLADFEMKDGVEHALSAYRHWHNFDQLGRVTSHIYLEIERGSF